MVALWREVEDAAMRAVEQPGSIVAAAADRLRLRVKGGFLWLILPSGRPLAYASPRIEDVETSLGRAPAAGDPPRRQQHHPGVGAPDRIWRQVDRERRPGDRPHLLAAAMLRLEAAGYPILLSMHDEIVAEVPHGFGSVEHFEQLMCQLPDWAAGCPVAAEGWRGLRYRK